MQLYARRCLIAAALVLPAAIWVNLKWAGRAPEVEYRVDFAGIPTQIAGMAGERVPVEERIYNYLGADAVEEIMYRGEKGNNLRLSLVYGKDWRAVHSPLSCYPQQGWLVDSQEDVEVPAPPGSPHPGPLKAQLLLVHKGEAKLAALYTFAHKGGTTADWTAQGWEVARQPRGTGGLMVALSIFHAPGKEQEAVERLENGLREIYLPAVGFWYR